MNLSHNNSIRQLSGQRNRNGSDNIDRGMYNPLQIVCCSGINDMANQVGAS